MKKTSKKSYRGIKKAFAKKVLNSCENYITQKASFIQNTKDENKERNIKLIKKQKTLVKLKSILTNSNLSNYKKCFLQKRISNLLIQINKIIDNKKAFPVARRASVVL